MPREEKVGPAPQIELQTNLGAFTIAFTEIVSDADEAKLFERLDLYTRAIERERAKIEIIDVLTMLTGCHRSILNDVPGRLDLERSRMSERARAVASYQAGHQFSHRRGEFELTAPQKTELAKFDIETERLRTLYAAAIDEAHVEIPKWEEKLKRLREIIEGGSGRKERFLAELNEVARTKVAEAAD